MPVGANGSFNGSPRATRAEAAGTRVTQRPMQGTPACVFAGFDPRLGPRGGRDLRAHRRDLQHDVLDLAGDELHRRAARDAGGVFGSLFALRSACRCCRRWLLTLRVLRARRAR